MSNSVTWSHFVLNLSFHTSILRMLMLKLRIFYFVFSCTHQQYSHWVQQNLNLTGCHFHQTLNFFCLDVEYFSAVNSNNCWEFCWDSHFFFNSFTISLHCKNQSNFLLFTLCRVLWRIIFSLDFHILHVKVFSFSRRTYI